MNYNYIIALAVIGYFIDRYMAWRLAQSTHTIVNNERSVMLGTIANLSERVAKDNPTDKDAQKAAWMAREDADRVEGPRDQYG